MHEHFSWALLTSTSNKFIFHHDLLHFDSFFMLERVINISFLYFNQNSLSGGSFFYQTAQREGLRGILVNQFMRQTLIGFLVEGKIERTLNTFSWAAWCWLKIIIISSRERRNIWLQIITIIKGIKDVLSGLADKWLKWFLFPSLCTLKNSVKKKNCLKLSHYPSNCVCFSP